MKKNLLIILVVILLIVGGVEIVLTLQNSNNSNRVDQSAKNNNQEDVYTFVYGEKEIVLGNEFSKEELGEEEAYSEIASCAFEGLDKTYTYTDYEITTFPDGEKDRIYSIYFLNTEVATKEGVRVSDSIDDMIKAYGENYEKQGNQYTYTKGNTNLEFIVESDVITSIQYTYIAEN